MDIDIIELFLVLAHIFIVILLTIICSIPFFTHKTRRTFALAINASILSVIIGIFLETVFPSSVNPPSQYLFPVPISLIIALLFLLLEEEEFSSRMANDNSERENESKKDQKSVSVREKQEFFSQEDRFIQNFPSEFQLESVDKSNQMFIGRDGLVFNFDTENRDRYMGLCMYFLAESKIENSDQTSISGLLETLNQADLEFIPRIYNPRLLRQKYQNYMQKFNINELFNELPEDKNKELWLSMLKERAALITLIKNPLIPLPTSWLVIKFYHRIRFPPTYVQQNKILHTFFQETITQFTTRVNNIAPLYLQNFIRLKSSTPFAKKSIIFLHKYELPPIHHLVPLDEIYLDKIFQKEISKAERSYLRHVDFDSSFQEPPKEHTVD